MFIDTFKPYIDLMDQWITKGQLQDTYEEFFIYVNKLAFEEDGKSYRGPRYQWERSYGFRQIDMS
jgi:hypothetical protein